MTYKQAVDYLYSRLPMFSRIGSSAIKKDLTNTIELCKRLGNPQQKFKTIHVGGTNGKGSVSHMLAAVLQEAGYKTGLYTSPHLRDFRERIRINGTMIPENEVVNFITSQEKNIEEISPSFFEATVAMAFSYFAAQAVDIAVIEVGLGGRLDSTNIISPVLSIITNISLDHVNILGNTLPEIAYEKAGIIKPSVPVIIGEFQEEVKDVFLSKAKETASDLIFASSEWTVVQNEAESIPGKVLRIVIEPETGSLPSSLELDLTGHYQLKNIKTVLSAVKRLQEDGFQVKAEQVAGALKSVKEKTGLMGRWQILSDDPLVICDTGHNEGGIREVIKDLAGTPHKQLHIVIGMVKDKDISTVLSLLPVNARYYFCQPSIERAKPVAELANEAKKAGLEGTAFSTVKEALSAAKAAAKKDDLIYVGGSTFVVAEVV